MSFVSLVGSKYLSRSSAITCLYRPSTICHQFPVMLPWNNNPTQFLALRLKSGVKTNSGCKKRFRVRGSGSIKRGKSGASHNTGYKARQRVNRLGSSTGVEGKAIEQRVRRLLGVSGKP
ncbi:ribosomal protein L35 [Nitzschia inconspicua]|uniref:Ribosomal protein L35 n=1 Tax=Nitzschia inconspicua TaxID=303405 RepID=A0A9K3KRI4_9STRA|nr:ribosomal protein L35 [Nitzschia inconspicua]